MSESLKIAMEFGRSAMDSLVQLEAVKFEIAYLNDVIKTHEPKKDELQKEIDDYVARMGPEVRVNGPSQEFLRTAVILSACIAFHSKLVRDATAKVKELEAVVNSQVHITKMEEELEKAGLALPAPKVNAEEENDKVKEETDLVKAKEEKDSGN